MRERFINMQRERTKDRKTQPEETREKEKRGKRDDGVGIFRVRDGVGIFRVEGSASVIFISLSRSSQATPLPDTHTRRHKYTQAHA